MNQLLFSVKINAKILCEGVESLVGFMQLELFRSEIVKK